MKAFSKMTADEKKDLRAALTVAIRAQLKLWEAEHDLELEIDETVEDTGAFLSDNFVVAPDNYTATDQDVKDFLNYARKSKG